MLREGRSFSGREKNCVFLNTFGSERAGGRFADVSAASGMNFPDDARAVASSDWDGDGDLDLWVSNRNAPRLRFLRNNTSKPAAEGNHFVAFKLVGDGTTTNRDAIGSRIEVILDGRRIVRTLRAGEGFLSQSSKTVTLGLGKEPVVDTVTVRWPGAADRVEAFEGVTADRCHTLVQGSGKAIPAEPRQQEAKLEPVPQDIPPFDSGRRLPLFVRLSAPSLDYESLDGSAATVGLGNGTPVLLNFWSATCRPCLAEMSEFTKEAQAIRDAGVAILALNTDRLDNADPGVDAAKRTIARIGFPFAAGMATDALMGRLQEPLAYLKALRRPLPLPSSFLIDGNGDLAVIYLGLVSVEQFLHDAEMAAASQSLSRRFEEAAFLPGSTIEHPEAARTKVAIEVEIRAKVAEGLRIAGRYSESAAEFERLLELDPDSAQAHNDYALVLRRQGDFESAKTHYERALALAPDSAEVHNNYGVLLYRLGDTFNARRHYEQAIQLNSEYADAEMNLGVLAGKMGDPAAARRHYERARSINPRLAAAEVNLGLLAEQQGLLNRARDHYQSAIKINDRHADAYNNLGVVCARLGDVSAALQHIEKAIEMNPRFAEAHNNLGIIRETQNDWAAARTHYEDALHIDPDYLDAKRNLANVLRRMNR